MYQGQHETQLEIILAHGDKSYLSEHFNVQAFTLKMDFPIYKS